MKQYVILGIALLTIISLNIWQAIYLKETSQYLLSDINDLKNSVFRNDYESAKRSMQDLKTNWDNMMTCWDIFSEHDNVGEISQLIVSLDVYVDNESKIDIINTYALLRQKIDHVLDSEAISPANIF